jgi:cysteine-rich repeat protein
MNVTLGGWKSLATMAAVVCLAVASDPARAASSSDYPGPCIGEVNAEGSPFHLSVDYHGVSTAFAVVVLPATGRFKLGISCVATGYVIVRVGPDSALCTQRGRCTPDQIAELTQADIEALMQIPNEVPFFHRCVKHSFGWYDETNVPPGIYLAFATSRSGFFGLFDGHGTVQGNAFVGNNGNFQPVNCPPPPVCGNFRIEAGETCDDGNTNAGDCCSPTCTVEPAGSACGGSSDLCTPGTCNGFGGCVSANGCSNLPLEGTKLQLVRKGGKEKLVWRAKNPTGSAPSFAPVANGATLELYSPGVPDVALALPAAGWSGSGGSFKFRNPQAPDGISPVRTATVIPGKSIKLTAARTGFTLTAPLTGVGIRLVSGAAAACTIFPPSTLVKNTPSEFAAKGPTVVPDDCDRERLRRGIPDGDLNPGIPDPLPDPRDPIDPCPASTGTSELLPIVCQ